MSWREDISRFQQGSRKRNIPTNIGDLISDDRMLTELLTKIYGHKEEDVGSIALQPLSPGSDITGNLSDSGRLRLIVKLKSGQKFGYHWFVKIQPQPKTHENAKLVAELNLFQNEIEFYQKVAPEIKAFVEQNIDGEKVEFDIPELIYADIDEEGAIIILEDLVSQGYKQQRDEQGEKFLSLEKALLSVSSIAKLQAASYALQVKKNMDLGQTHPILEVSALLWTNEEMMARLSALTDYYCEVLRESRHQDSPALIERFRKTFNSPENLKELCRLRLVGDDKRENISCLQQGDFHFNNLMFLEEAGQTKVKVVDWQMAYNGKAGGDIAYLLMSSISPALYEAQEEIIKAKYFEEFNKTFYSLVEKGEGSWWTTEGRVKNMLEKDYKDSLPLGFLFSCGNVVHKERERAVSFAYMLCNEAAQKNLI